QNLRVEARELLKLAQQAGASFRNFLSHRDGTLTPPGDYADFLGWRAVHDSVIGLQQKIRPHYVALCDPEIESTQFVQLTVQDHADLARLRDTAKALSAWVVEQAYGGPKATPPGGLLESLCGATDLLCQALSETGLDNNRPTRPSARHSSDFRSVHWY